MAVSRSTKEGRPAKQKYQPAIFIDKDGTLINNVPYNANPELITLTHDAGTALADWQRAGYKLLVISNQSGVARGLFTVERLGDVSQRIQELLAPYGVRTDGFYYCPHAESGGCDCRKPAPGLLLKAAREHRISLTDSWMVGDILHDVEAGHRAGCRSLLFDNGGETEWQSGALRYPDDRVTKLTDILEIINHYQPQVIGNDYGPDSQRPYFAV